jgi:hypothetical protein
MQRPQPGALPVACFSPYTAYAREANHQPPPAPHPSLFPRPRLAQLYAYTSSHIQIAILELFCRTDALLPNLYVGTVTRESIQRALEAGISAGMITGYLDQHAHPKVADKVPCVPAVVTDQVGESEGGGARVGGRKSCSWGGGLGGRSACWRR